MIRKLHDLTLGTAVTVALLAPPMLMAQAAPPQAQATPQSQPTDNASVNGRTTFHTDNGTIVTVRSHHPEAKSVAPAPPFATLDTDGNGIIDTSEVNQYPPLANDFKYADSNRDNTLSKAEYQRWTGQP